MFVEPKPRFHANTPDIAPIFPLSGALLMPGAQLPLSIFEPRYLRMVDDALGGARTIGMIQPRHEDEGAPLFDIGCAGRITAFSEAGDGRYMITLTGIRRFVMLEEVSVDTPYRQARVDWAPFEIDARADETADSVDREMLLEVMHDYLDAEGLNADWDAAADAPVEALIVSFAMGCPFAPSEKQALLEARTIAEQAECLMALMEMSGGGDDSGARVQ